MSYLYDLVFIFSFILITFSHTASLKRTHIFFVHLLEYLLSFVDDNVDEGNK